MAAASVMLGSLYESGQSVSKSDRRVAFKSLDSAIEVSSESARGREPKRTTMEISPIRNSRHASGEGTPADSDLTRVLDVEDSFRPATITTGSGGRRGRTGRRDG